MSRRAALCTLLAAALGVACDDARRETPRANDRGNATPAAPAAWNPAATERLPARFDLGRTPTPQEIARVDIDVDGEGRGLPPGGGTPAEGAILYAARCAVCHGADGSGTPAGNRLVNTNDPHTFASGEDYDAFSKRTIGNYWPYAPTLFDYIRRAMPLDQPGSLTDDEVYAAVAWLLWKNRLVDENARMDAVTLPRVRMPARDRFVPDDRETVNHVR